MSLFEPQFVPILKSLNSGDFGIAKRLFNEAMNVILATIEDDIVRKQFIEFSEFPYSSGNWALERTILSSMMEAQKASVLMSLNYLKIFGDLQYVTVKFTSGPNPEVSSSSYISTARRLSKILPNEYKGSFSEVDPGKLPNKILLGKYHENGGPLNPSTSEKSGKIWVGHWPQYRSTQQYEIAQLDDIKERLSTFDDEEFKQELITKRSETLAEEYSELDKEAQLRKNPNGIREGLRRYYRAQKITNQEDKIVTINVEEDYDIKVTVTEVDEVRVVDGSTTTVTVDHHTIVATLKDELSTGSDPLIRVDGTKRYEPNTLSGNTYSGISNYVSRLLPVVLDEGILTLVELGSYIAQINKIIGEIISKRITNEFEFMDPKIAQKSDDDELKKKYYLEDNMIFNGKTKYKNGKVDLVFKIEEALAKFEERGNLDENDDQMKFANTILSFMSIPMNTYTEMLRVYKSFILRLMNPLTVATLYTEFIKMDWLEEMVTKEKILGYLNSIDNTIYTTNLFDPVARTWPKEDVEKQKKFYEELINKYIEQVSSVYNKNLSKISL